MTILYAKEGMETQEVNAQKQPCEGRFMPIVSCASELLTVTSPKTPNWLTISLHFASYARKTDFGV